MRAFLARLFWPLLVAACFALPITAQSYWQSRQQVSVAAPASIAFVNAADGGANGGGGGSSSPLTFSYTVGASSTLLVVVCAGDAVSDAITGGTYNSVSLSLAKKQAPTGAGDRWNYLFFLSSPATGAHNVVVSASSSILIICGAADYSGANTSGQPDATVSNAGITGTSLTTSITTVANNSWAVLNGVFTGFATITAGAGLTLRVQESTFGGLWALFDSAGPITPAGSYSMTTNTSFPNGVTHTAASFKP